MAALGIITSVCLTVGPGPHPFRRQQVPAGEGITSRDIPTTRIMKSKKPKPGESHRSRVSPLTRIALGSIAFLCGVQDLPANTAELVKKDARLNAIPITFAMKVKNTGNAVGFVKVGAHDIYAINSVTQEVAVIPADAGLKHKAARDRILWELERLTVKWSRAQA